MSDENLKRSNLSVVDDVGTLFFAEGRILRRINRGFEEQMRRLFDLGLIGELVELGLIPATKILDERSDDGCMVLEHQLVEPVIYPFEWSPEMLRKAAMCVLDVNELANKYGYELKDAHPYNVVFNFGSPIYVDIGSIVERQTEGAWVAQSEFMICYCRVLEMASRGMFGFYKHMFLLQGVGVTAAESAVATSRFYGLLGPFLTTRILKVVDIYRNGRNISAAAVDGKLKNRFLAGLVKSVLWSPALPFRSVNYPKLRHRVSSIKLSGGSKWGDYHSAAGFYDASGNVALSERMKWVLSTIERIGPRTVMEIAGNQGALAREVAKIPAIEHVICSDYDFRAVDQLVLRSDPGDKIFPACFDMLGDIREALTGERAKRLESDLVVALAVIHHLVLTQRYSLDRIFDVLAGFTRRYVIVEHMPLGLWNGEFAPALPGWYNEEWFTQAFEKHFDVLERIELEKNRIAFFGELRSPQ